MMTKLIFIIIFITFILTSCNSEDTQETFQFGFNNEFGFGELNKSEDNLLKFTISGVNDSRCPIDVFCFWQGKVDVEIAVESWQSGSIFLSSHNNEIDTFGNFSFQLIDVTPYPISTQTIKLEDYNVVLKITELKN
ncbi:MAG: hypothetical protein GQ525_14100 [Draconibacterium sp.]|nr:hypothetical protein [Draconibacterium sp.]